MPDNDKTSTIVTASIAARSRTARAIPSESLVKACLCGGAAVICSARMHCFNAAVSYPSGMQIARKNRKADQASGFGRMNPRNTRIKLQNALDPFRHAKRPMILSIRADDLEAERKTVFAEPGRQRHGGRAQQGPGRTIVRVAGIAQAFGRFAKRRQRQHGVEAR